MFFLWKHGQKNRKTTLSPLVGRVFLVNKRTIFFFGWVGAFDAPHREGLASWAW